MGKSLKKRPSQLGKKGTDGRPKITFSEDEWEQIDKMCHIHCTGEEIASILRVDYDTLNARIKEKHGVSFSDYWAQKSSGGKASLRRTMYQNAINGNPTLQIWLSKNWLGMTDKTEQVVVNKDENQEKIKELAEKLAMIKNDLKD